MRIALVAAEPSGDRLGADLMAELKGAHPQVRFEGIGGPAMARQGLTSWFPMEKLSVMGLVEVVRHLPELLALRRELVRRWLRRPPDLFIGIDAPDFNLNLERRLREAGVATVHYVSPTVWAWREGRVEQIRRAADLVLCIFPFEPDFLRRHGIAAHYVGHPLAQAYPLEPDTAAARRRLGLAAEAPVLALLPGSRMGEVARMAPPFLGAAQRLARRLPGLRVVTPTATPATEARFRAQVQRLAPELAVTVHPGATADVLTAADLALVASGTATFEALLCKCPMVVGYRLHPLSYGIIRALKLVKTPQVAMANLLADRPLAPELLQGACRAEPLAEALEALWEDEERRAAIKAHYLETHRRLRLDAQAGAAAAVLGMLGQDPGKTGPHGRK